MRILIVGLIVLALSVAGISTYLIQNFSTPTAIEELEQKAQPKKFQVLVALRPLYPGDKINLEMVTWQTWPEEGLNEQYISIEKEDQKDSGTKKVLGSIVRGQIQVGEPILTTKLFKSETPGFMAGMLGKGMRAISVPVTEISGVAGFVLPGNYVDVLIVHNKAREALQKKSKKTTADATKPIIVLNTTTETVLTNIKVLAVNQVVGKVEGQAVPASTLTLELTPKQVELLMTASSMGKIAVSLRDVGAQSDEDVASAVGKPGTYTTDVEVSPFLQKLNAGLLDQQKTREQLLNEEISILQDEKRSLEEMTQKQLEALSKEKEQAILENKKKLDAEIRALEAEKSKAVTTVTAPKKKPVKAEAEVIEIYRGGASESQELKVQ
jgi:pilus assembly protein CpaB